MRAKPTDGAFATRSFARHKSGDPFVGAVVEARSLPARLVEHRRLAHDALCSDGRASASKETLEGCAPSIFTATPKRLLSFATFELGAACEHFYVTSTGRSTRILTCRSPFRLTVVDVSSPPASSSSAMSERLS